MSKKVIDLLKKHGPMLSGELARFFEKEYKVSNEAARKALSRANEPVKKIYTLSFDKNQKFFYLKDQFMSEIYTDRLLEAIKENSQINWMYICAFNAQGGYMSKDILPAFVSAPIKNVKGHKLHDRIIDDLLKCKIIEDLDETHWKLCDWVSGPTRNLVRSFAIESVKKQVINDFAMWARNINLIAYNSAKTLIDKAEFANFQWGFTAPCYVQPIFDLSTQKNGFVVADVFYGKRADVDDVKYFIDKVTIVRNFKKIQSFMPVFISEGATPEAQALLKEHKILIAYIKNIFDEKYTELLAEIVHVITCASAIIKNNPEKIEKLFMELSKAEGRYNDIIGDMFELMVGYYYQQVGCNYLQIKKNIRIPNSSNTNELDVLTIKDGTVIIAECKATRAPVDDKYVERWLSKNIPQIREWMKVEYSDRNKVEFQLWSLGGFTTKALEMLQQAQENVRKYSIRFFEKESIMRMVKEVGNQTLIDMLKQHFDPVTNKVK